MKPPALHDVLLRIVSWLVPKLLRADWLAEWQAEVWYVQRHGGYSEAQFCLGALQDAIWLRFNGRAPRSREALLQSPQRCLFALAAATAGVLLLALLLPGARDLHPSFQRVEDRLVMLGVRKRFAMQLPSVPVAQYAALRDSDDPLLAGLAFYRPVQTTLEGRDGVASRLTVAIASDNLFELLRVRFELHNPELNTGERTPVVLHERAWRRHFGANRAVVGKTVKVNGENAFIAGVLAPGSWRMPGRVDAWLLRDRHALSRLPESATGFVVGALRPSRLTQTDLQWNALVPGKPEVYSVLHGSILSERHLLRAHLFLLVLALLMVPLVTPMDVPQVHSERAAANRIGKGRWWLFLLAKAALLIFLVFRGVQDLASMVAMPIQAHGLLLCYVLALRWALLDQRRRCPECLRLVTHPARIGSSSHTFLDWYGQELVCPKGHGLLYVPEIATSSNARRWQTLDSTWAGLFAVRER